MQAKKTISILAAVALVAISCSKAITILLINRSDTTIIIEDHGRQVSCDPGQAVSFIPEKKADHDIAVRLGAESLFYLLTNIPATFSEVKYENRLYLIFGKDRKLYLLKPTNKPMDEEIGLQPSGYPLIPK